MKKLAFPIDNETLSVEVQAYREELMRLSELAVSAPPRTSNNGRATYATNKPNWCRCGGTVATLPSGSQLWGCESCIRSDQRRREESRPVPQQAAPKPQSTGMYKIKDLY